MEFYYFGCNFLQKPFNSGENAWKELAIETTGEYVIESIERSNEGDYKCEAHNSAARVTDVFKVDVVGKNMNLSVLYNF